VGHTFGFHRWQAVSALGNAVTLVVVALGIFREAWERLSEPPEIVVGPMLAIAVLGLVANIGSALVLHGHEEEDINVRGAFLHVLGDGLASLGVIVAALIILLTGQTIADSIVSVLIGIVVAYSSIGLLRRSLHILTEGTPVGLEIDEVVAAMRAVPGVTEVHDLHAWSLGPGFNAVSAHVIVSADSLPQVQDIMFQLRTVLHDRFGIEHRTIQIEWANCGQGELTCYIPELPPVGSDT
jgi:cobalt-zinc-cadmium efflux system protein